MARHLALIALVLVALAASTCSAARWGGSSVIAAEKKHHDKVMILFKYTVPPAVSNDFIKAWDSYIGDTINKAPGFIMAGLSQPMITNTFFNGYSEWETMEDFLDYKQSKDAMNFFDCVGSHDIKFELQVLTDSTGMTDKKDKSGSDKKSFTILSLIVVKPSKVNDFVKTWQDAAEKVMDENDNEVYHLAEVLGHNDQFYLYGSWATEDAWKDHLESDHIHKLAQWTDKNDVVYFNSPLKIIYNIMPAQ